MRKVRMMGEAGFTLMEMLIVVLIVGILAAIAGPLYIGYTRDARMSEAKSIAGNVWTAMQGCAQAAPGVDCTAAEQYTRAGLTPVTGNTSDGQWTAGAGAQKANFAIATNTYTLSAPVQVDGIAAKVTEKLSVQLSYDATKNPPGTFGCSTTGAAPYNPC